MNTLKKNEQLIIDIKTQMATLDMAPDLREAAQAAVRSLTSSWAPDLIQDALQADRMASDLAEVIDTLQFVHKKLELAGREQPLLPIPMRRRAA